jgi:hypothetical protein
MLFREIGCIYFEKYAEHADILWGQNTGFLNATAGSSGLWTIKASLDPTNFSLFYFQAPI